jgi:hypothetical protein
MTAFIAAGITVSFARTQANIAQSQRDIALDKLKFDLFEKRYAIYAATKELLEHMALVRDLEKSESTKIRSLYITLDEARFYFPSDICRLLSDIHTACESFFTHLAQREQTPIDNTDEWRAIAEVLAADLSAFRLNFPLSKS